MALAFCTQTLDYQPVHGAHGPLTREDSEQALPFLRVVELDDADLAAARASTGQVLSRQYSEQRMLMILRSLGIDEERIYEDFDPEHLLGLVGAATCLELPVSDDGMETVTHGNWTDGAIAPGFYRVAYDEITRVCLAAREAAQPVVIL